MIIRWDTEGQDATDSEVGSCTMLGCVSWDELERWNERAE
jgi:hypothetical protein